MEALIALLMTNPDFLKEIDKITVTIGEMVVRGVQDIFFKSDSDPNFRSQWLALSAKLASCQSAEDKLAILNQMGALRAGSTPKQ